MHADAILGHRASLSGSARSNKRSNSISELTAPPYYYSAVVQWVARREGT